MRPGCGGPRTPPRARRSCWWRATFPSGRGPALDRVHDQLPPARGVPSQWDGSGRSGGRARGRLWRESARRRGARRTGCPTTPPNAWRGVGDHGQGGEGMMGGMPYGRPMAMTAEDIRDGLAARPLHRPLRALRADAAPGTGAGAHAAGRRDRRGRGGGAALRAARRGRRRPPSAPRGSCGSWACRKAARRVLGGRRPRGALGRGAVPPGLGRSAGGRCGRGWRLARRARRSRCRARPARPAGRGGMVRGDAGAGLLRPRRAAPRGNGRRRHDRAARPGAILADRSRGRMAGAPA